MMLQGMTADMLLRVGLRRCSAGDTILIHAAAGGVGLIMCQWAAALGATVIGTVSTEEKAELARAHGCHHPIVYSQAGFRRRGRADLTDGREASGRLRFGRPRHVRPVARLPSDRAA